MAPTRSMQRAFHRGWAWKFPSLGIAVGEGGVCAVAVKKEASRTAALRLGQRIECFMVVKDANA